MERDPSLERFELRGIGPAEAAVLCDRIEATGAATEVRELADSRMQDALSAVERMAGVSKAAFRLIARALVDRVS